MMALYRNITAVDMEIREISLQEPLDTSQPIDVFFNIINYGVQYYREENKPYMTGKVLQMSYHAVISSVIYINTCKDWCGKKSA